jgi:hypothetical protein
MAAILVPASSVFPIAAGLSTLAATLPTWWGPLDVLVAFTLAATTITLSGLLGRSITKEAKDATYRAYRFLTHGILVLLVVFFLAGDRITWINCLTGFAWRAWLLLYTLPVWFTALEPPSRLEPARS